MQTTHRTTEPNGLVPPKQQPYELALRIGFDELLSRTLDTEKLEALGVERDGSVIRVPAPNRLLLVDLDARAVSVEGGGRARPSWALIAVHYLCADDVSPDAREVSLAHFSQCRGYLGVFQKRIVGRFLWTSGRTARQFEETSRRAGGMQLPGPGLAFRFRVLPRVPVTIVRHEGDDELGPGASVTYLADIENLLPAEDCVVAAELVLDTLSGKPMDDGFGGAQ